MTKKNSIFKTDKRIRLGIWGLGRGMSFYNTCAALNFDVVAGCDYNEHMRKNFADRNPGAFVTSDADAFLNYDMDAVLLATFCPSHGNDAIRCMEAGKHVMSEVTSFHTMAEGARLVEAVERSGLIYNLAENYPFTKENMYLAAKWREGLFGELMYAEYEYLHDCRPLSYMYGDYRTPIQPGYTVHNWRSWIHFHYYNTHSLGPMMHITGTRPARVVSLPGKRGLVGFVAENAQGIAPSLITMSNGAVVRNLMGATTNDNDLQRIWGTRGAAEINKGLFLRLGAAGHGTKIEVTPAWPELGEYADTMGHWGGDFWVLYYFARQILFGEPAFFDIYTACDCTIPGILAYRSAMENGKPYDVPDFRDKKTRDKYRNDNFAQKRYNVEKGCFPKNADRKLTSSFSGVMRDLIYKSVICRSLQDWLSVIEDVKEPVKVLEIADSFLREYDEIKSTIHEARKLAEAYPRSDGARALREMLEIADADIVMRKGFLERIRKERAQLKRKCGRDKAKENRHGKI